MKRRMMLIVSLTLIALTSGCSICYHEAVLVDRPQFSVRFRKPLIYEGIIFQKGLYFQGGEKGDIMKGFADTFRENMMSQNMFETVVLSTNTGVEAERLKQEKNALSMIITTNLINEYKPMGFLFYAEITAGVVILNRGTKEMIYGKKYYIKRHDSTMGIDFLWEKVMKDLVNKILDDLSKGDFDNPSYHDIKLETIEV